MAVTIEEAKRRAGLRFTEADMNRAADDWGANCGPGAIAAICGLTLDELRPHLGDFERKGHTNPTLMLQVLAKLHHPRLMLISGARERRGGGLTFPVYGLARIQWEGPWTNPGVPMRVRYRHTHWVGAMQVETYDAPLIFDVNAIHVGGWIWQSEWSDRLVPWLLEECEPKANGRWHLTHSIEVERRA